MELRQNLGPPLKEVYMYSKEDRERILADYAASGLTVTAFSKLPGNPSRNSLRSWLRQAERGELDIPERKVRGRINHVKHARYPKTTKREALSLLSKGMRPCDIARRLGIPKPSTIMLWARKASDCAKIVPKKGAVVMDDAARERIEELERELADARLSLDALKEMVRDPKVEDPASLSNKQKAELGERLRRVHGYRLKDLMAFLKISKSSYEYAKKSLEKAAVRAELVEQRVRSAFEASGRTYGYRRVKASIISGADGEKPMAVSEREVRRAMGVAGMIPRRTRRRRRYSSYEGEVDTRPANLPLQPNGTHRFSAPAPGMLAVTDVTEFKVAKNTKVYLSPVVDCFDGLPAAWSISRHPDSSLVDSSLKAYLNRLPKGSGPVIVHTDGGGTYRSASWKRICAKDGVVRSMSRKACCPDNARAEGFFGSLKEEFYYGRDWSRTSPEKFAAKLNAYLEWYADGRLKSFQEAGVTVYDTIKGRRQRLGYAV